MSQPNELYSLLIPLQDERLLVPRVCIAEVIAFADMSETRPAEAPPWYLGEVEWSGRPVPVVTLDEGVTETTSRRRSRRRVVIFYGLTEHMEGHYYGVLTQGFPQLVRVNRDVLSTDPDYVRPDSRPLLCRVRMIHEFPLIPDFDELESMIALQLPGTQVT